MTNVTNVESPLALINKLITTNKKETISLAKKAFESVELAKQARVNTCLQAVKTLSLLKEKFDLEVAKTTSPKVIASKQDAWRKADESIRTTTARVMVGLSAEGGRPTEDQAEDRKSYDSAIKMIYRYTKEAGYTLPRSMKERAVKERAVRNEGKLVEPKSKDNKVVNAKTKITPNLVYTESIEKAYDSIRTVLTETQNKQLVALQAAFLHSVSNLFKSK